jgi:hypothetical protein
MHIYMKILDLSYKSNVLGTSVELVRLRLDQIGLKEFKSIFYSKLNHFPSIQT